jgi:SAM-dependent methyltransferase
MTDQVNHDSVRRSYDQVASLYLDRFRNELDHKPLDRALLRSVIEQGVRGLPVGDLGCGPGHVAAWLAGRGARAVGIDLSASMLSVGRQAHPQVEFRLGDLLSLPAGNDEFGAVVALYSIIHLHAAELQAAFSEMKRALAPDGVALISFHLGTETRHVTEWWGTDVALDFQFFEVTEVIASLEGAGFVVEAQLERTSYPHEVETRRGYLLARRPSS